MALLAFVAGTASVHTLATLPAPALCMWMAVTAVVVAAWRLRTGRGGRWLWPCVALLLGVSQSAWRADARLQDALAEPHQNAVTRIVFDVTGLPQRDDNGQRVEARLVSAPVAGIPRRLMLSWYAPPGTSSGSALPELMPGQRWKAAVLLRRPGGTLNPHGFDYQALLFERGIRATGTLRGVPERLDDRPWDNFDTAVQRVRHQIREAMAAVLADTRYGAVIVALALGDQAGVAREDWDIFNRTGITHLVSISGMHVTLVAALGGLVALHGWKRLSWRGRSLAERGPAQVAGAVVALFVAWAYCLLAGWGVPAQRTFFMLAVVATSAMVRLPMAPTAVLALAAALVVLFDPWAVLAVGFWLSFGAVAVLMLGSIGRWRLDAAAPGRWLRWRAMLREATWLQLGITVGLMPLLAFHFQQVSLVSPLANAPAIPVVTFVVTPLALVGCLLVMVPGAQWVGGALLLAAERVFAWLMWVIVPMADWPWATVWVAAAPWPLVVLGCAGVVYALQPRGLPGRALALMLVLPALLYMPDRPARGDWRLVALDVGQGAAVVVETANHTVLYDTGPPYGDHADAGSRVIVPYLRARGVRTLAHAVVSHADADHAGGVASVLAQIPVTHLWASYDLPARLQRGRDGTAPVLGAAARWAQAQAQRLDAFWPSLEGAGLTGAGTARGAGPQAWASKAAKNRDAVDPSEPAAAFTRCDTDQRFVLDDVVFSFTHPTPATYAASARSGKHDTNALSCVLRVQGRHHAALLTGDIGTAQEVSWLARDPDTVRADVVTAGHHGSRTSSDTAFVTATGAAHAIAQVGMVNRYGHPHAAVEARWRRAGTVWHRSDRDGAVVFTSRDGVLRADRQRETGRRYWHGQ